MNREEWLAERMTGIGGSDAAAALGLSHFKTAYELWLEKTRKLAAEDLDEVERIRFGNLMESVIADEYSQRENVKVRRRNQIIKHPKYPWMLANVDRLIDGKRCGLECKNVDGMAYRMGEWGEPGTDEVPDEYLFQCAHYMIVLDYPEWHLAACVGGNKLATYVIRRDPELEQMIVDGEQEFWNHVEHNDAPEPDFAHPTTAKLLQRLYPGTDGTEIILDPSIEYWDRVKHEADGLAKQYDAVSEGAKNHIVAALGNAALGRLPDGSAYRRKAVTRKAYSVEAMTYIDCRHVKAKE